MTRPQRIFLCCIVPVFALLGTLAAFDWPLDTKQLRFGFGSVYSVSGAEPYFSRGMEFGQGEGLAVTSDDGELVFAADADTMHGAYPLQGGSLFAVSHSSDILTIYTGLERTTVSTYMNSAKRGDTVGKAPDAQNGRGMMFYCYDTKNRRYINPDVLLPKSADDKAPVIRSVVLRSNSTDIVLESGKTIRQGSYDLIVDCYDASPAGLPSGPFEIRVLVDGSERTKLVYDAMWVEAGSGYAFSAERRKESDFLSADKRLRLGSYSVSRGRSIITLVISDYAGNAREQSYSLTVQ